MWWTGVWSLRMAVCYMVVVAIMLLLEGWLIYKPLPGVTVPRPMGLEIEDVWFEAEDGTRIHAWYVEHPEPRAQVLYAHGNAGDVSLRGRLVQRLRDRFRVSVLIFDYRGFGQSEGSPHEAGVLMDARAARDWLAQRAGIEGDEVVLLGCSLGTGVVVDLAARDGARGLVLQSPYTSLPDVAGGKVPFLPVHLVMRNRFESLKKIGQYRGPLLIGHGDSDPLIPVSMAQQLFEAAHEPKTLIIRQGGDHDRPIGEEFLERLDRFFDELL